MPILAGNCLFGTIWCKQGSVGENSGAELAGALSIDRPHVIGQHAAGRSRAQCVTPACVSAEP